MHTAKKNIKQKRTKLKIEILQETPEWIAIYKPTGLVVEENPYEISVQSILKEDYPYIGIIHRLDRVTSGVMLLAKKRSALKNINKQFSERSIEKKYQAIVSNKPPKAKDSLKHLLEKDQKNKIAIIHEKATDTKTFKVHLDYEILAELENGFLLDIIPLTGKFHQIRVQLAYIGCPILDDSKYNGIETEAHLKKIALQAQSLSFNDPKTDERITVQIEENFRYKI